MNFVDSWYEDIVSSISSPKAQDEFIISVVRYYYTGEMPAFKHETAEVAFMGIRYLLQKMRSGRMGGQAKSALGENANVLGGDNGEANCEANSEAESEKTGKQTSKHNIKEKDKDKDIATSVAIPPIVPQVVAYLNEKTGRSFKPTTALTVRKITARVNEGFAYDDFKRVIDTKTRQWKDSAEYSRYLRPETLFGSKFEGYLNENPQGGGRFAKYA